MEEKLTSSPNYNRGLTSATVDSIVAEGKVDVKEILENFIFFSKKIIEKLQRSTICGGWASRWLRFCVLASRCLKDTVLTGHIAHPAAGLRATRALRPLEGGLRTGGAALR